MFLSEAFVSQDSVVISVPFNLSISKTHFNLQWWCPSEHENMRTFLTLRRIVLIRHLYSVLVVINRWWQLNASKSVECTSYFHTTSVIWDLCAFLWGYPLQRRAHLVCSGIVLDRSPVQPSDKTDCQNQDPWQFTWQA